MTVIFPTCLIHICQHLFTFMYSLSPLFFSGRLNFCVVSCKYHISMWITCIYFILVLLKIKSKELKIYHTCSNIVHFIFTVTCYITSTIYMYVWQCVTDSTVTYIRRSYVSVISVSFTCVLYICFAYYDHFVMLIYLEKINCMLMLLHILWVIYKCTFHVCELTWELFNILTTALYSQIT